MDKTWPMIGQKILVQDVPTTEAQRELWANRQPPTRKGEVVEVPSSDGGGFLTIDVGGECGGVTYAARDFGQRYTWKPAGVQADTDPQSSTLGWQRGAPEDLTLAAIDSARHLAVSEDIVGAVAFAARAAHSNQTAGRFVTALVMKDALQAPVRWGAILKQVMDLEAARQ